MNEPIHAVNVSKPIVKPNTPLSKYLDRLTQHRHEQFYKNRNIDNLYKIPKKQSSEMNIARGVQTKKRGRRRTIRKGVRRGTIKRKEGARTKRVRR